MSGPQLGATGTLVHRVSDADSATNWGNDARVLATPVLLWLGEITCMRAIDGSLAAGQMTLGTSHDAQHLAPTPVGHEVVLTARLVSVDGPRLEFDVEARDGELVFRGRHGRAVVDRTRFLARVEEKARGSGAPRAVTGGTA